MIAYCGIDCSNCPSYIATQSRSRKELIKVAENLTERYQTEVKPEYVICDGCKTKRGTHTFVLIYAKCGYVVWKRNMTHVLNAMNTHVRIYNQNWIIHQMRKTI